MNRFAKAANNLSIAAAHVRNSHAPLETRLNASQSILFSANNVRKSMKQIQGKLLNRTVKRKRTPRSKSSYHKK